jgi:hypothetical protein
MTLGRVPVFAVIAIVGLTVEAAAQTPCPELSRLRDAATQAWKHAMRVPRSERCGALYEAAAAAEATLAFTNDNQASCGVAASLLSDVERDHREAVTARDNVCAGRPLRPYPPDIIQH